MPPKRLADIQRHESVAVSSDWQILARTTRGKIKLQHLNSGQLLQVLEGYLGDDISSIALSPSGFRMRTVQEFLAGFVY